MERYSSTRRRKVDSKNITSTVIYPEVAASEEDYYIITSMGDRYDILAKQFYGSSDYWWVIASVNPQSRRDTLFVTPGIQLRIPPYRIAQALYEKTNRSR